jgi:SPX domain protein involved in polyphosphate accumulation
MEQTQIDRHEKKYLLPVDQVTRAKEIILANTKPDEHADHYMANTMYWDSEGLSLYKSSVEQAPIRFKLRARWYGDDKIWLEIKRREDNYTKKSRLSMPATVLDDWANGKVDTSSQLVREFVKAIFEIGAKPILLVRYNRQAFDGNGAYTRITIDDNIQWQPVHGLNIKGAADQWKDIDLNGQSVVECKYAGEMPIWMATMVEELKLVSIRYSKYIKVVSAFLVEKQIPALK